MKTCKDCKTEKDDSQFYGEKYHRCKPCHSIVVKQNQKQKAEYYNAYKMKYASEHPEKVDEWMQTTKARWEEKYGRPYKEYVKEISKRHTTRGKYNPEAKKRYNKKYYNKNRESILEAAKVYRANRIFNTLLNNYLNDHRTNNINQNIQQH